MKVVYHKEFENVYTSDPAAAPGRMEAVLECLGDMATFIEAEAAPREAIASIHTAKHIEDVERMGLYDIAALAAGGAIQAAVIGMDEPSFGLIRPPGHHASAASSWGFCYFNNMAMALERLRFEGRIEKAFVLDFDLHFGDGTVNILQDKGYVSICNPASNNRREYLLEVERELPSEGIQIIGICAGFDQHVHDWGGLLTTEDYNEIGRMARAASHRNSAGIFAILEGGYNHEVLGKNVMALMEGMEMG
jgi:acetoin utilization deacetylase AcuC-like enzyme